MHVRLTRGFSSASWQIHFCSTNSLSVYINSNSTAKSRPSVLRLLVLSCLHSRWAGSAASSPQVGLTATALSSISFQVSTHVLKKSTSRPGVFRPPLGLQLHHGFQSSVKSPCLVPLSPWGPESKLTSSKLVGEPTVHAWMSVTQTPAFLQAQGLSVVLKCITVRIPFFF